MYTRSHRVRVVITVDKPSIVLALRNRVKGVSPYDRRVVCFIVQPFIFWSTVVVLLLCDAVWSLFGVDAGRDEEDGILVSKEAAMEKRKVQEAVMEWQDLKRRRMEDGADEGDVDDEDVQDVQVRVAFYKVLLECDAPEYATYSTDSSVSLTNE